MTEPEQVILFVASANPHDISVARREPDGTMRRAAYANVNWIDRFTSDSPAMVSLSPQIDLLLVNARLGEMLQHEYVPSGVLDLSNYLAGYYVAMRRYHGSDFPIEIAQPPIDVKQLSESVGVHVPSYDPDKNSTNRLNWTIRVWERTRG